MFTERPKLEYGKYCYVIMESSKDENGYIPCIAVEGDESCYQMSGNGPHASPWYWGKDYKTATQIAHEANNKMGITLADEIRITQAGMRRARGR